jgi:hypothetical protein
MCNVHAGPFGKRAMTPQTCLLPQVPRRIECRHMGAVHLAHDIHIPIGDWPRVPLPEGLSFESLPCVEISFGIARIAAPADLIVQWIVRGNST